MSAITIKAVRGLEKTTGADRRKLYDVAQRLGCNVDHLATCISFETAGTFSPSIKNAAGSGATGLIQFLPSTAKNLGTTTAELANMSFQRQLDYVEKYFAGWKGRLKTLEDVYAAILWPAAVGKPNDYVLWTNGSTAYIQNAGFDRDGKGYITKADVSRTIRSVYTAATGVLPVGVAVGGVVAFALTAASAVAWAAWRFRS